MKRMGLVSALFLGLALVVSGCAKKPDEQANAGFDTVTASEDIAQLPQANATQQAGVEMLPIETSPVTQGAIPMPPSSMATAPTAATDSASMDSESMATGSADQLTHEQKIQTALRNAGLYQGAIDGKIGPASRRAIQAFQTQSGLKVDGKVGPKTWAALEPYLSGGPASQGTTQASTE